MAASRLINRNINASRGRTSMRLEPELWDALEEICERERVTMREVVRRIEQIETDSGRTSAVRVFIVDYFRTAACAPSRARPVLHSEHGEMALNGD